MSRTSATTGRRYGLKRVGTWESPDGVICRMRSVLAAIRTDLPAQFQGEGARSTRGCGRPDPSLPDLLA